MASYSLEDIETLRSKSGISYQEAVALLDYHNGSLARALVDLEKKGKLNHQSVCDGKEDTSTMKDQHTNSDFRNKALNILHKLYRNRIKIRKNDTTIVNVSLLFAGACLLFAPHLSLAGFIISIILGYRFSYSSMDPDFTSDRLEKMVMNAAQNAKSSVSSVVQSFSAEMGRKSEKENAGAKKEKVITTEETPAHEPETTMNREEPETAPQGDDSEDPLVSLKKQTREIETTLDSFFSDSPGAGQFHSAYSASASSVPTIQIPVRKETRDGTVHIDDDQDGYSSVTIG